MNNKIAQLIERAENLKDQNADTPEFNAWSNEVIRWLKKIYGENSHEVKSFEEIQFFDAEVAIFDGKFVNDQIYQDGLQQAILYLKDYLNDVEEEKTATNKKAVANKKEIFVVHGRNEGIKAEVSNFLRKVDIKPIILHEQVNKGKTVIEKFEEYSNVDFAIVLFTADDTGKFKEDEEYELRARQNVIFEAGYFIGKLGRKNTIILYEYELQIPSDLNGYIYIPLDPHKRWHLDLTKELNAAGFDIAINNL
jgi:predicted nucleotide-binding protein